MRLLFASIFILVIVSNEVTASGVDNKKCVSHVFEDNLKKIKASIDVNERRSSTDDNYILTRINVLREDITSFIDNTVVGSSQEDIKTIKNELEELKKKIGEQSQELKKHTITLNEIKSLCNLVSEVNSKININEQEVERLREENVRLREENMRLPEDIQLLPIGLNTTKPVVTIHPPLEPPIKHKNCVGLNGTQNIYPFGGSEHKSVVVFCDNSDGGGWTVIQNRDSSVTRQNFYRQWSDYVQGFGDINGEFWLGLENIYALVNATPVELKVDLEPYDGAKAWAKYESFKIGDASTKYALALGKYSGNAGDSLSSLNGRMFSTYDQDNDQFVINCASKFRGAWWYEACGTSNLNGYQHIGSYYTNFNEGIYWESFRGSKYSLKKTRMKIRAI